MNKLLNQKKLSGLGPIGIFAASMIILFIIFQDKLVKGMMAGAVKG